MEAFASVLWFLAVGVWLLSGGIALGKLSKDFGTGYESFGAMFFFCLFLGPMMYGFTLIYLKEEKADGANSINE